MKLATLNTGGDGDLIVVSRDLTRGVHARAACSLQAALERWDEVEPALLQEAAGLEAGDAEGAFQIEPDALAACLPRSYQFLDASAFLAHNHILARAWGYAPRREDEPPLMYQGLSSQFYAAHERVSFLSEDHDVDFEGEIGVIVDAVQAGVSPSDALRHAKLVVMINDWSLRRFGPDEMRGGFGFLHAKPPSTLSAFAVTPDELGDAWQDGRVALALEVWRGDALFGEPSGASMHFGFGELIAHAARTRDLCAATVIGSGTVSNDDASEVGSACIAERRALDVIAGRPLAPYLSNGERIRIRMRSASGNSILGWLDQPVSIADINSA